jgi:hypothetical protein
LIQPLRLLRDREGPRRTNMIGARAICGNRLSFFLQIFVLQASAEQALRS